MLRYSKERNVSEIMLRSEVFTAVAMKNAVLWDLAPCRSYVNRRFGGTYRRDAISSSETSVYTRSTRRHIPEDGILSEPTCFRPQVWAGDFLLGPLEKANLNH
jgi:hypothetical protein